MRSRIVGRSLSRCSRSTAIDSDQPLRADDGTLITEEPWGIYVKPDRESVQGGAAPIKLGTEFTVDPYPTGTVEDGFPDMWTAALSHCLGRFEGVRPKYRQLRSGGAGAFTVTGSGLDFSALTARQSLSVGVQIGNHRFVGTKKGKKAK